MSAWFLTAKITGDLFVWLLCTIQYALQTMHYAITVMHLFNIAAISAKLFEGLYYKQIKEASTFIHFDQISYRLVIKGDSL